MEYMGWRLERRHGMYIYVAPRLRRGASSPVTAAGAGALPLLDKAYWIVPRACSTAVVNLFD